jgi:hypothetical protein
VRRACCRALIVLSAWAVVSAVAAAPKDVVTKARAAGGEHWRLQTPGGRVHVWQPANYERLTAGIVLYVHGFSTDVDAAWERQKLARQFAASRRNAVFVVPEAPSSSQDPVPWPSLNTLLAAVGSRLALDWPSGPLVVVGHSGAHRTVVHWLKTPRLSEVVLLDAIYGRGMVEALRTWLLPGPGRLILVDTVATAENSARIVRGLPSVVRRAAIPESGADFTSADRSAQVVYLRSQYAHSEMVNEGKAIATLLALTHLSDIALPAR